VRRQYWGNVHGLIKGIGVVNCVYYNAQTNQFWLIDYRIFSPETDGKFDQLKNVLVLAKSFTDIGHNKKSLTG
jgi:hypothetical protein